MEIRKKVFRYICHGILLVISGSAAIASADTMYVSDQLKVAMRSGTSTQYRIISFLPSGTAVNVLGASPDGSYQHVQVADKDGWVETDYLMKNPAARDQLVSLHKQIDGLNAQLKQKAGNIADLKNQIKQLQSDKLALKNSRDEMSATLIQLKKVAANPVAIAEKNKSLEQKLSVLNTEYKSVVAENAQLSNRNIKEWFVVGGGVSIISLFFGLIIPNIRWRKRDSWSGGF